MAGRVPDMSGRFAETLSEFEEEPRTAISKQVKGFRPRVARAHMLRQTQGPTMSAQRLVLDKDTFTIGRAASNDLVLENDNVSRTHARLTRVDEEYTLEDLDSRNGILLNGLVIHAAVLRDGDELQIGDFFFTYQEGA